MNENLIALRERLDGWTNTIIGFGGARDEATKFNPNFRILQEAELSAMYATEDLSAKIVDVYPREALRLGWELGGFEQADESDLADYLKPWCLESTAVRAAIWGRLFGLSAIWLGSGAEPTKPFVLGEQIEFLRVIDGRWLIPSAQGLDLQGRPTVYQISPPDGGKPIGQIHASRLVLFPGALTDERIRLALGHRDLSVLQRPYNALKADGLIWQAAQLLLTEASVGVIKIKGLFGMVAGKQKDKLTERLRITSLGRSIAKSLILDADKEDYSRVATTFAGVSDLNDRSLKRVASAADMPVTVLIGEAPAGLSASGDNDRRWFHDRIDSYRYLTLEEPITQLVRAVLASPGSPLPKEAAKVFLIWPDLWTPSAKERSEIYSNTATADAIYLDRQVVTPEEIAMSRFGEDGYSQETQIDRDLREGDQSSLVKVEGEADPADSSKAPVDPNAPAPTGDTLPDGSAKPADKAMNGSQIAGIQEVVRAVAAKEIPRDAGLAIVKAALGEDVSAEDIIGTAGAGFTPAEPEPAAPFGNAPTKLPPPAKSPAPVKDPPEDAGA